MVEVRIRDTQNQVVGTVALPEVIYNAPVRAALLSAMVVMQLANRRRGTVSTRTRSEVHGSDVKPWRQKGTGRARAGTRTSPLWRKGGVIFGPKPRDYSYLLPKKARKGALRDALSIKVRQDRFVVVDGFHLERPCTRDLVGLLRRLEVSPRVLILLAEADPNIELSARNVPGVKVLRFAGLNVYDLLTADTVICPKGVLPKIEEVLLP